MPKDKRFSEIMKEPDINDQAKIWDEVMKMAQFYEDGHGYNRDTVLHGLWKGVFSLNFGRNDQKLIRSMNERRRFLLFASQDAKRQFDQFPSYRTQRLAEEKYGKDMLYLRDTRNCGWEEED